MTEGIGDADIRPINDVITTSTSPQRKEDTRMPSKNTSRGYANTPQKKNKKTPQKKTPASAKGKVASGEKPKSNGATNANIEVPSVGQNDGTIVTLREQLQIGANKMVDGGNSSTKSPEQLKNQDGQQSPFDDMEQGDPAMNQLTRDY